MNVSFEIVSTVGVHSGFKPQYYAEYLKKSLATFLSWRTPRSTEYFYHIKYTKHNYAKRVFLYLMFIGPCIIFIVE